jgi:hypothetical protein
MLAASDVEAAKTFALVVVTFVATEPIDEPSDVDAKSV